MESIKPWDILNALAVDVPPFTSQHNLSASCHAAGTTAVWQSSAPELPEGLVCMCPAVTDSSSCCVSACQHCKTLKYVRGLPKLSVHPSHLNFVSCRHQLLSPWCSQNILMRSCLHLKVCKLLMTLMTIKAMLVRLCAAHLFGQRLLLGWVSQGSAAEQASSFSFQEGACSYWGTCRGKREYLFSVENYGVANWMEIGFQWKDGEIWIGQVVDQFAFFPSLLSLSVHFFIPNKFSISRLHFLHGVQKLLVLGLLLFLTVQACG